MPDLLTTRQVQELLQVDRTTIYRMLNEGRIPGFKVGGQWRFSRDAIEAWLQEQERALGPSTAANMSSSVQPGAEVLPISCVQSMQDIFAEAMEVGSVVTRLDGQPVTEISNSCEFCNLILSSPSGRQGCISSWRRLANQTDRQPQLHECHAGLKYARGRIEVGNEFVAMVFVGQLVTDTGSAELEARVPELAARYDLDQARLQQAVASVHHTRTDGIPRLFRLLQRMADTLSEVGCERLGLLQKLRRIAEITSM
ncbi:MAG: PocR ligand-binding domain-containing protein [Anaerolineae bacterium]